MQGSKNIFPYFLEKNIGLVNLVPDLDDLSEVLKF